MGKTQFDFEVAGIKNGKAGRWKLRAGSIGEAKRLAAAQGVDVQAVKAIMRPPPAAPLEPASAPGPRMITTRSGEVRPEDFYDRLWAFAKRAVPAVGRGAGRTAAAAGSVGLAVVKETGKVAAAVASDASRASAPTHVCLNCGLGSSPVPARDNAGCGCLLTLLFLVPGLLWFALSPVRTRCPYCRSENVIPAGSPRAQELLQQKQQPPPPAASPPSAG